MTDNVYPDTEGFLSELIDYSKRFMADLATARIEENYLDYPDLCYIELKYMSNPSDKLVAMWNLNGDTCIPLPPVRVSHRDIIQGFEKVFEALMKEAGYTLYTSPTSYRFDTLTANDMAISSKKTLIAIERFGLTAVTTPDKLFDALAHYQHTTLQRIARQVFEELKAIRKAYQERIALTPGLMN